MLADNIQFLRTNYPGLFEAVNSIKIQDEPLRLSMENTKNDKKTVSLDNGENKVYLHSRYDPIREAQSIIIKLAENEQIDEKTHVVFYGVGLGYHIDVFTERFPNTDFSLYEPSLQVFSLFLNEKSLKSTLYKKMVLLQGEYESITKESFFNQLFIRAADKNIVIFELPIYEQFYEKQFIEFLEKFKRFTRQKRMNLHTEYKFQKSWTQNSVKNLKMLLKTPNILMQHGDIFKDKPAIIVSAGPSLDFEIENLRRIKEEGLAFIFSVGSAISTFISNNIMPDAVCGFDPSNSIIVYKKLIESGNTEIPMIFGSRIGPVVIEKYSGPKYHMIMKFDHINRYFLKDQQEREIQLLVEIASIAVVTIQLVHYLGFSKTILVGQNLSFFDNRSYAGGIDYQSTIDPSVDKRLETVPDVNGNQVYTNVGFNAMRYGIESFIDEFNMNVINTTVGGAAINGAEFIPMETVLKDILTEKVVQGNEFKRIPNSNIYDRQYLLGKIEVMEKSFIQFYNIVKEIKILISKIRLLIKNNNKAQTEVMYNKLDREVTNMEENAFFGLIAMPMNAVHYYYLLDQTDHIKYEKDMFDKIKLYIEELDLFMTHLNSDEASIKELMVELTNYKCI